MLYLLLGNAYSKQNSPKSCHISSISRNWGFLPFGTLPVFTWSTVISREFCFLLTWCCAFRIHWDLLAGLAWSQSEGGRPLESCHEDIRSCRLCGMTSYFYLFLTLWLISLSSYVNHVFEVSINFSVGFQPELELDRAFCGNQLDFHICDVPNSFPSQNSRTIAKWTEPTTEASQTSSWYSIFSFKDTTLSTIITWHPQ